VKANRWKACRRSRLHYADSVLYYDTTKKKTVMNYRKHKTLHVLSLVLSSPVHVLFPNSSVGSPLNTTLTLSQYHFPLSLFLSAYPSIFSHQPCMLIALLVLSGCQIPISLCSVYSHFIWRPQLQRCSS